MKREAIRTLPHSIEAEELLLSTCLLDGNEVVGQCIDARITEETFYEPKHGILYKHIVELYNRRVPIETAVLALDLKRTNELDRVGGYAFLSEVTKKVPTHAQASYFIDKVKNLALLRSIIRGATGLVEDCYGGDSATDLLEKYRKRIADIEQDLPSNKVYLRGANEYPLLPDNSDEDLLGEGRYISRGDGVLLVSSSGMGKSSLSMQWAVLAALGRPHLGIKTHRPLKSLIVQSEDSDGDVGEVMESLRIQLELTDEQWAQVGDNVKIVRDDISRGDRAIVKIKQLLKAFPADLLWLNPLHAFAGCDISDAEEMGHFLREGLNALNKDKKFAIMLVHHTPKPSNTKTTVARQWYDMMYEAAGSAELINWARTILVLKPTKEEGDFNLYLAKRGTRAGVRIEAPGSGEGVTQLIPTNVVPCRHSRRTVQIEGRKKPFRLIFWEGRDADQEDVSKAPKNPGSRSQVYSENDILGVFPDSTGEAMTPLDMIKTAAVLGMSISKSTFFDRRKQLIFRQLVEEVGQGKWRRTQRGDELVSAKSKQEEAEA